MSRKRIIKCLSVCGYMLQYSCIAHCTLEFVGDFVVCSGPSMEPTIHTSDIVLTDHISVSLNRLKRGDVVISRSPINPHQYICKRVRLLEGDKIIRQPESAVKDSIHVPKGHVWLEGDNGDNSTDSRKYGPVPVGLLRSRVFFKVWPVGGFGAIKGSLAAQTTVAKG